MTTSAAQLFTSSPASLPVSVKAVLFDFDGTLWDPESHIFQCYQEVFREYGCVLPSSLWSSVIGTIGFDLWSHLEEVSGIRVNRAHVEDGVRRRTAALLSEVTSRPGIHGVLDEVDTAGLPRGIVSNSTRSWIRRYAAQCGIAGGWKTIRSADGDPMLAKPSPQLYRRALADLGVDADEALAFEDSPTGVRAATAAGIRCIAVPNQMTIDLDLSAADLLVDSYENVDLSRLLHATRSCSAPPPSRQLPERMIVNPSLTAVVPSADPAALDHYFYPPDEMRAVRGEGIYLYDEDGRRYLDCSSGTFNLSLGYSHPEIVQAVREQACDLIHVTSKFQSGPVNDLIAALNAISPPNLTRVHLKSASGSDANEGAVKIAQHYTGKTDVITMFRGHLGQTLGMINASGAAFRRAPFPMQIPGVLHVPDADCGRCFYRQQRETCGLLCVERINDFIDFASSGRVAAMILEPITGNGGNLVPPEGYLQALRDLCDERDILLVFDEIQTGFGRTGQMFAADYFGVAPHMMTFGKGLGGSGMPVAGILTEERLTGLAGHHINSTFGGNVLAASAAVKTIEIISRPGFLENVRTVGAHIMARLREMAATVPFLGDVRGAGLMIGVEIVAEGNRPNAALTNHLATLGMEYGLLLRTSLYGFGNVLKVRPALIMTVEQADEMCDLLEQLFRAASE